MASFTPIRLLIVVGMIILIAPMGLTYLFSSIYGQYGREGCSYLEPEKVSIDLVNSLQGLLEGYSTGNYNQAIIASGNLIQRYKNSKTSFETMSFYAITEDEKQLAKSLIRYCDYSIISSETNREIVTYYHNHGIYGNRKANYQQIQELEKIQSKNKAIEGLSEIEKENIVALLDRMPKYQDDFKYLYGSGGTSSYKRNVSILDILAYLSPILMIISVILFFSLIAYIPIRKDRNRIDKIAYSLLFGMGLPFTIIGILGLVIILFASTSNSDGILVFILPLLVSGIFALRKYALHLKNNHGKFIDKRKHVNTNEKILTINPDKKESTIAFLKAFDELSDKEILAFMYMKNNPNTSVDNLNEQFGEEIINALLQKGHFIEEIKP